MSSIANRGWTTLFQLLLFTFLTIHSAAANPARLLIVGEEDSKTQSEEVGGAASADTGSSTIVINLSNEQVERLIHELKTPPADSSAAAASTEEDITQFVQTIRAMASQVQQRIQFLRTDAGSESGELPEFILLLRKNESTAEMSLSQTILSVTGLFCVALIVVWLFRWATDGHKKRLAGADAPAWQWKLGKLLVGAIYDIFAVVVFVLTTLLIFFLFMDRTGPQSVMTATYLTAFLIVMLMRLAARNLLSPEAGGLRLLPITDETSRYLYRWITAISIVGSFGWLTCGLMSVAGASEANHLIAVAQVYLAIIVMLIVMILQKREAVRQGLAAGLPESSVLYPMVDRWHRWAILAVGVMGSLSLLSLALVGIREGAPSIQTLFIVPLYLLLDWLLREALKVAFGIAKRPDAAIPHHLQVPDDHSDAEELDAETTEAFPGTVMETSVSEAASRSININRLNRVIGTGLRMALAGGVLFYLLEIWGIDIRIGKMVTRAVFNILVAVLVCYVSWELISAAIHRRLKVEMPEDEEEREEGGAGGSRIGTLLLLLRKFLLTVLVIMALMIILSSLGVNIGPMIAGAGVIGLAIGFGAQTLVKDIISGIFFLLDDAFRVGDYVDAAGTRGTVEHISLRSLQLRHPRGMVNTIPFSDIGIVTNFSRDYIITKLDFRVRYDTDVEKVRKIIKKKVYKKILANEALASKLLGKIKSQGVRQLEDSAMIMRVKYKTIPGEQFAIRKEVYRLMQEAFKEAGIEFAHRNVTVYMPQDSEGQGNGEHMREAMSKAAAAAALTEEREKGSA